MSFAPVDEVSSKPRLELSSGIATVVSAAVVAIALVAFVVQNRSDTEVTWLFIEGTSPLWVVIVIAAVAGAVVLRGRGRTVWPLLATVVTVTITAALFYGQVRFRIPAEVALVVLAAVAVDEVVRRVASAP